MPLFLKFEFIHAGLAEAQEVLLTLICSNPCSFRLHGEDPLTGWIVTQGVNLGVYKNCIPLSHVCACCIYEDSVKRSAHLLSILKMPCCYENVSGSKLLLCWKKLLHFFLSQPKNVSSICLPIEHLGPLECSWVPEWCYYRNPFNRKSSKWLKL